MTTMRPKARHRGGYNHAVEYASRSEDSSCRRNGGQAKAPRRLHKLAPGDEFSWFVSHQPRCIGCAILAVLPAEDFQVTTLEVPDGEACKTTEWLTRVWEHLTGTAIRSA